MENAKQRQCVTERNKTNCTGQIKNKCSQNYTPNQDHCRLDVSLQCSVFYNGTFLILCFHRKNKEKLSLVSQNMEFALELNMKKYLFECCFKNNSYFLSHSLIHRYLYNVHLNMKTYLLYQTRLSDCEKTTYYLSSVQFFND